tara:strand:+ start:1963 stop:2103 length:141 start_codon:yes stop_codon:yes gene_type:complete
MSLFKNLLSNRLEIIADNFKSNVCGILSDMNPFDFNFLHLMKERFE